MPKEKAFARPYRKGMKLKTLSISDKLKVLDDIEAGVSMHIVCERYGIKKSTFYDIRRDKAKIRGFADAREDGPDSKKNPVRRIKGLRYEDLDAAVYKWYKQERSVAVAVRGVDIQEAAGRFATHLGIKDFKASSGWLYRFRNRHCIADRRVVGESKSADLSNVEPFRKKLISLIKESGLLLSQVYNADDISTVLALITV